MRLKHTFPSLLLACSMVAAIDETVLAQTSGNPFLKTYKTPFEVPPFEQIKTTDFIPAFKSGMDAQKKNIGILINKKEQATFENTIETLEMSSKDLDKVSAVFYNLTSANTNPELEKIAMEIAPLLSQHADNIYMDAQLFKRVKYVYDKKHNLKLNEEKKQLLDKTYKSFIRSGAQLNSDQQNKMRKVNQALSLLTLNFGQNILAETNNFDLIIDKESDLSGLPESLKSTAAQSAKSAGKDGKWRFTLHSPSVMPFLQYADNRDLRKKMYDAYINRANHDNATDNKEILSQITALRAQKATLLGYANHAAFVLEENMALTPESVYDLLNKLWVPALRVAKSEKMEMQKTMNQSGVQGDLEAWDWFYYADKVKKEKYNFAAEELRPYFKLENVRNGIFTLTKKLYGLQFTELNDLPKYHKDVSAYEVEEADGSIVGILYMDFHARDSKRSGAWMTSYRKQAIDAGKRIPPIISIVCNFSSPIGDQPALLTPTEVTTFFHEFGHALHGLLSNVQYRALSGTSVPRDFVELPSQIMEHWAFEPEMLALYAHHYQTNEIIPTELITKLENASKFNQGFQTVEYLAASFLDMAYHTLPAGEKVDVAQFEKEQMDKIGLIKEIAPRYRSTYFQHVFAGGYSAGYYSYIWSEVLDSDAFSTFKESGDIFNKELAEKFRKSILEKGGTGEPMDLYKDFRGKEPDVKHLLKNRGLDIAS